MACSTFTAKITRLNVQCEVEMTPEKWSATLHFPFPMQVGDEKSQQLCLTRQAIEVEIEITAVGSVVKAVRDSVNRSAV